MSSVSKMRVGGRFYHYASECKRVGGKPKIVWQKYLGKIEDIVLAAENRPRPALPEEVTVSRFGAVAAPNGIAQGGGSRGLGHRRRRMYLVFCHSVIA